MTPSQSFSHSSRICSRTVWMRAAVNGSIGYSAPQRRISKELVHAVETVTRHRRRRRHLRYPIVVLPVRENVTRHVERAMYLAQSNLLRRTANASRDISSFD